MAKPITFKNEKGETVKLTAMERRAAEQTDRVSRHYLNAMGIEIPMTTLTECIKSVSEQRFYEISPAEFMPLVVGEGAFSTGLLKTVSYNMGGSFEQGIIHQGTANSSLAQADAGLEGINIKVYNWAKGLNWSLPEIATAARNGNWDVITEKEKSRKKNWDLGIQRIAFLGSESLPECKGLLNLPNVSSNLTVITKSISSMSAAEYRAFISTLYAAYRANSNYTAEPDVFIIPEADYNGLASPVSADFPLQSKLQYLSAALNEITGHEVQIKKLVYSSAAQNGLGVNRYVLLRKDPDTLAMNIPVDYTSTMANTVNGFNWENAAYGQFTGVTAFRPKEILYFDYAG